MFCRQWHKYTTLAARAMLGGPEAQWDPTPPVLGHFVDRNSMGSKI